MQDPARAERMRAMIEERWGRAVQTQLALSDQQMERLRGVQRATAERRLGHERREMELARAIGEQLRPGVSADQDSLALLLDGLAALRVERAQAEQQELRELAQFLTPVQRARLLVMRRQFEARIDAIRGGRPGMGGPMRPGAPPGAVPGGPPGEEPPGS